MKPISGIYQEDARQAGEVAVLVRPGHAARNNNNNDMNNNKSNTSNNTDE